MKTLGGWVETWHIYKPASSFNIGFMCKRQLFGYWNVTLNRGSPVWVIFPTDNKENLSTVRRTHITCTARKPVKMVKHFGWFVGRLFIVGVFSESICHFPTIPHSKSAHRNGCNRRNREMEKVKGNSFLKKISFAYCSAKYNWFVLFNRH